MSAMLLVAVGVGATFVAAGPAGSASAAPAQCQGQPATIVATADGERLQGTDGPDVISTAGFEAVTVQAKGGDDLVCATSRDRAEIYGDAGEDTLVDVDDGQPAEILDYPTLLVGGAGDDHFIGNPHTWVSYRDAAAGVSVDAAGTVRDGADTDTFVGRPLIQGSPFSDRYVGTPGNDSYRSGPVEHADRDGDVIRAGAGDDTVIAYHGSVRLGAGDDHATGYGATVAGEAGDDTINLQMGGTALGGSGDDRLLGDVSLEEMVVQQGAFRLSGGPGNDVLSTPYAFEQGRVDCPGSCARGRLAGGGGVDTLVLDRRRSVVDLAAGRVRVLGGISRTGFFERVVGSRYADVIRGNARANRLVGRGGSDVMVGRGGADVLIGGGGRDRADGGAGRDRCRAEVRRSC